MNSKCSEFKRKVLIACLSKNKRKKRMKKKRKIRMNGLSGWSLWSVHFAALLFCTAHKMTQIKLAKQNSSSKFVLIFTETNKIICG